MSRSYRKHFVFASEQDKKWKKYFNRKVRRHSDVDDGAAYKKLNDSWLIKCFHFRYDDEEDFVRRNLPYLREGETEADLRKVWRIHFLSK